MTKRSATPAGQTPISQDPAAVEALKKWCGEQRGRRKVADLHKSTDEFERFSNQSLAKKMALTWDQLWGSGAVGPSEESEKSTTADALMQAARGGVGIGGKFVVFVVFCRPTFCRLTFRL